MKTFVTVFLWISDIVLDPDDFDISLHFQKFCHLVKLILKRTDHADSNEILQVFPGCVKIRFQPLFQKLRINTFRTFDPTGSLTDHSTLFLPGKLCIDHLKLRHKDIDGSLTTEAIIRIFDITVDRCSFFFCQLLMLRFQRIRLSAFLRFLIRIFLFLLFFDLCQSRFKGFLFFPYFFL